MKKIILALIFLVMIFSLGLKEDINVPAISDEIIDETTTLVSVTQKQTTTTPYSTTAETTTATYEYQLDYFLSTDKDIDFTNLNALINGYCNDCGIYVKSLVSDVSFSYNSDTYIDGASTVKLPYAYYCYTEIDSGRALLTDTMLYDECFRTDGTGEMQFMDSGEYFDFNSLLYYCLYRSDNVAYNMLYSHFGYKGYNRMVEQDGFISDNTETIKFGKVSPHLLGFYWQKAYDNFNKNYVWQDFYYNVTHTKYSPLREVLGNEYTVANKSGWSTCAYHESGIVYADKPYVIVIMTKGSGDDGDNYFIKRVISETDKIMSSTENL